jgi:hypothetical protein
MFDVTFNINIDEEKLEKDLQEIEELQNQVEKILNMNSLIRWFYIKKAQRLHNLAEKKMIEIFYPTLRKMQKDILNKEN